MAELSSRRSLFERQIWKLKTGLQKRWIFVEDRLSLFPYWMWIKTVEQPQLREKLARIKAQPNSSPPVGFFMTIDHVEQNALRQSVKSLQRFGSLRWTLSFLLPPDAPLRQAPWFRRLLSVDTRLGVVDCAPSSAPSDWVLHASQLPGDWLVPLAPGDQFSPAWADLFCYIVDQNPAAEIIYWDEDRLSRVGIRSQPFFKPDWSPAYLISTNYLETAAFRKDFLLRCSQAIATHPAGWPFFITGRAGQIEHIPSVMQHRPAQASAFQTRTGEDHVRQVCAALNQAGYADVQAGLKQGRDLRVSWRADLPMVTVIIPTKNNLKYLERCLVSLLGKTVYPDFEVILIDDHSTDQDVLAYYEIVQASDPRVRVFPNETEFNYSRVNNDGASLAKGQLLLFLNNDTEILHGDWLAELVRWVQLPGVGMVGAKLLYPDQAIQHAGIVVGMTGHANHVYGGTRGPAGALFVSPDAYRDVSAVTGACMLVRKDVFESVGKFNEDLRLVFNDVELCQRVRQAGYRIVYVPSAELLHYEGRSRSRYNPPGDIRLGAELLSAEVERGDRYYNPNLSLAVNWPTLRRPFEPGAIQRLQAIVRYLA